MKKTYFMKSINLMFFNLFTAFLLLSMATLLKLTLSANLIVTSSLNGTFYNSIISLLHEVNFILFATGLILMMLVSLLISVELYFRLKKDSIQNWIYSIFATIRVRRFLTIRKSMDKMSSDDTKAFNKAVNKIVIDVNSDLVKVLIDLPLHANVQEIMISRLTILKEEITNSFPEYMFSSFERQYHSVWLIGTHTNNLD